MSIRELQSQFVVCVAKLILFGDGQGYEWTFGEAWRTPEQAKLNADRGAGIRASLHVDRLAIDLNLFIDGVYRTDTEAHRPLAVYWKTLHPLARWGGDIKRRPDGNHYSLSPDGRI